MNDKMSRLESILSQQTVNRREFLTGTVALGAATAIPIALKGRKGE